MHFSIPDTTEFVHRTSGSSFTGFNIHINGSFHACLRYKQMHSLHEQLKRALPNLMLPPFPSKRIFPLTADQVEDRRASLERYIQLIGQDPTFSKCELLRSFLLAAQQESATTKSQDVPFDVYLMNGFRIAVTCLTTDCSSRVLEKACAAVDLPRDFTYYFALFLMRKDGQGNIVFQRKLMDFEAPYITQRTMGADDYKCVVRKCFFDPCYDLELMRDKVALNLLYIQTVSDVERGWVVADAEQKEELSGLQSRGNKKEYLELARNLRNYGTIHFTECTVDYPERDVHATVTIGNKEITFLSNDSTGVVQETKFRVTRIRCWKISTIHNPESPQNPILELCFEFLMSKNYLKWIVIRSAQAMLITVCLQSMVNELLNQKSKTDTNNLRTSQKTGHHISFPKRDDTNQFKPALPVQIPAVADQPSQNGNECNTESSGMTTTTTRSHNGNAMKQMLKEISTTVFFKNNQNRESVHNEAFEDIGDEDL